MRVPCVLALIIFLFGPGLCTSAPGDQIAKSGDSSVRAVIGKRKIVATFHTFIAKKSEPWFPSAFEGYDELSFVQNLSITVDGQSLWVPRSAYTDLFDARAAAIKLEKDSFVLSIAGADGADAYHVRIYFDSKKVTRRAVFELETSPDKPREETRYAPPVVIKDE